MSYECNGCKEKDKYIRELKCMIEDLKDEGREARSKLANLQDEYDEFTGMKEQSL